MDAREIEILQYFEPGAAPVKPLCKRLPRSTVYRLLRALVDRGYLIKDGRLHRLQQRGRDALAAVRAGVAPGSNLSPLEKALPHLRHVPSPLHRAVLELVACAIVARRHRLLPNHHPSFVLFGPKLTFKTWTARAACYLAGGNPAQDVVYLGTESGRSMFLRRGAKGQTVTERATLNKQVIGLDEFRRAKPAVRRLLEVYLYGEVEIADEDGTRTIEPVSVLTMNEREGVSELDERLDLDEAMLRRAIVVDLSAAEVPPDLLAEGDVLLDRMRALGGADFPLPAEPGWAPRDEIKALFLATLDSPERLASIDITMFAMLATAATAWLPAEDALKLVVTNYLTIVEALGWTRPGWRSALAPRDTAPTTITETEIEDPAPNPYDYDAKLDRIAGLLSELGVTPDRMELALVEAVALQAFGFDTEAAATIGQELVERGLDVEEGADVVADCIVEADSLLRAIEPLRQRRDALQKEVGALSAERDQSRELLGDLSVDPGRVAALREIDALINEHNLDLAALLKAARDAAFLAGLKAEAKAVRKELGALKMTRAT